MLHQSSNVSVLGNESHEKEVKRIHFPAADLLHMTIQNPYWCESEYCENKAGEIDCIQLSLLQTDG